MEINLRCRIQQLVIFVIRFIILTIQNPVFQLETNYRGYILSGQEHITRKSGGEK